MNKVILTGGKTGGHVFPAIGFWESYTELYPESKFLMVGTRRGIEQDVSKKYGIVFKSIVVPSGTKYKIKILNFLLSPLSRIAKLAIGVLQCISIILKFKPDFIFSTGSFVSVPLLIAAIITGKKYFIHEQNVIFGRANKYFKMFAKAVFTGFDLSEGQGNEKTFYYGTPIRKQVLDNHDISQRILNKTNQEIKKILIIGGSQGAVRMNSIVCDMLDYIEKDFKDKYFLIHLAGENDFYRVKEYYKRFGMKREIYSFYENMKELYAQADLVIARAGASSISEINAWGLPMILFPIKNSIYDHQMKNALYQAKQQAAIVMDENSSSGSDLMEKICFVFEDKQRYHIMSEKSYGFYKKDSGNLIAGKIMYLLQKE